MHSFGAKVAYSHCSLLADLRGDFVTTWLRAYLSFVAILGLETPYVKANLCVHSISIEFECILIINESSEAFFPKL